MKQTALVGVLMLALGMIIGWLLRGSTDAQSESETADRGGRQASKVGQMVAQQGATPHATKRMDRAASPSTSAAGAGKDELFESGDMEKRVVEMMESMATRQRTRLEQHLSKIDQRVPLTELQKARIGEWLDRQTEGAKSFDMTAAAMDPGHSDGNEFSKVGLEEVLNELLSAEQKEDFEEFREQEKVAEADALALKNLSQIQKVISFEGDQRNRVYEILLKDADQRLEARKPEEDMSQFMHQSMGVELDPYDLQVESLLTNVYTEATDISDPKEMEKRLRDAFAKKVEDKVELLRPVLNQGQLDQYRGELQNRGGGLLDQMILGLKMVGEVEPGDIDVEKGEVIEIPEPD